MRERALEIVAELARPAAASTATRSRRRRAFLDWLADDHFTFLGYREYELVDEGGEAGCARCRAPASASCARHGSDARAASAAAARVRARALEPYLLNLTKANSRSTVHRPPYLDYVGVKRFDATAACRRAPLPRPLHAHRLPARARARSRSCAARSTRCSSAPRFPPGSHDEKALLEILETYPRDELFQISDDELFDDRDGDPRTSASASACGCSCAATRSGASCRCLVFVPRDRFNTENRAADRGDPRARRFGAASDRLHDARVRVGARAPPLRRLRASRARCPTTTSREIETLHRRGDALVGRRPATRRWSRSTARSAATRSSGATATRSRPPTATTGSPRSAVADIERIEELPERGRPRHQPLPPARGGAAARCALKLFRSGAAARALRRAADVREHGRARSPTSARTRSRPRDGDAVWIYDFGLDLRAARASSTPTRCASASRTRSCAPGAARSRTTASTGSCSRAGLTWREITRRCARSRSYLRQAGIDVQRPLHGAGARRAPRRSRALLVDAVPARASTRAAPTRADAEARSPSGSSEAIDAVESLDEDRILRSFLARRSRRCCARTTSRPAPTAAASRTCRSSSTRRSIP